MPSANVARPLVQANQLCGALPANRDVRSTTFSQRCAEPNPSCAWTGHGKLILCFSFIFTNFQNNISNMKYQLFSSSCHFCQVYWTKHKQCPYQIINVWLIPWTEDGKSKTTKSFRRNNLLLKIQTSVGAAENCAVGWRKFRFSFE